ncbi:MAG: nucleotide exchange factor GrpE [Bacillota bacterium]
MSDIHRNNLPGDERPGVSPVRMNPVHNQDHSGCSPGDEKPADEAKETAVPPEGPEEMMELFKGELNRKDEEYQDLQQQFTRLQADFENFRRRSRREQEQIVKFAAEKVICGLLPVLDNLERALTASVQTGDLSSLVAGVEMIYRQLLGALEREGLHPVPAVGQQFDPMYHEAVMQVTTGDSEENTVVEELQKGYTLGDKVIRPAMVKVAKNN